VTIKNREQAAQAAEASRTNRVGFCQGWTRDLYGAPSAGDVDHDGDADAVDGWLSEPHGARHLDRNPPRGVPVAWKGGSHGNGHRAVSLGGGLIRSTDAGGPGIVATVPLSFPEKQWGLVYLGWSDTIDGQPIPLPARTRGWRIDEAIRRLRHASARPGSDKAGRIARALDALRGIPTRLK
jgi:hypothetical protein